MWVSCRSCGLCGSCLRSGSCGCHVGDMSYVGRVGHV